jgi:hypothetical protein
MANIVNNFALPDPVLENPVVFTTVDRKIEDCKEADLNVDFELEVEKWYGKTPTKTS